MTRRAGRISRQVNTIKSHPICRTKNGTDIEERSDIIKQYKTLTLGHKNKNAEESWNKKGSKKRPNAEPSILNRKKPYLGKNLSGAYICSLCAQHSSHPMESKVAQKQTVQYACPDKGQ
jgi:hypothetical protein